MEIRPARRETASQLGKIHADRAGERRPDLVVDTTGADIDELVASLDGTNVFDAAVRSRLGFVQIGAHWRLPAPGTDGPYTHADHTHMHNPPKRTAPKWCLAPGGALGGFSWDVHGLERLPFLHGRTHKGLELLHCRAVSTGWKGAYRLNAPDGTRPDPVAIAALRAFDPLPQRP